MYIIQSFQIIPPQPSPAINSVSTTITNMLLHYNYYNRVIPMWSPPQYKSYSTVYDHHHQLLVYVIRPLSRHSTATPPQPSLGKSNVSLPESQTNRGVLAASLLSEDVDRSQGRHGSLAALLYDVLLKRMDSVTNQIRELGLGRISIYSAVYEQ